MVKLYIYYHLWSFEASFQSFGTAQPGPAVEFWSLQGPTMLVAGAPPRLQATAQAALCRPILGHMAYAQAFSLWLAILVKSVVLLVDMDIWYLGSWLF